MNIRPFSPIRDYAAVAEMWRAREWPVIPLDMLPESGRVAEDTDGLVAAGFLYRTDSAIALIEFLVSNPSSPREARSQALDAIISDIGEEAKVAGYRALFSTVTNERLISRYERHGFQKTDVGVTNMIRRID